MRFVREPKEPKSGKCAVCGDRTRAAILFSEATLTHTAAEGGITVPAGKRLCPKHQFTLKEVKNG
jgi:hypothetical protein